MQDLNPMAGFPPTSASEVNLANWQDPPFNRWAFQHVRELIPTQRIPRGADPLQLLPYRAYPPLLDGIGVARFDGRPSTVGQVLDDTFTDAVVVQHDGEIVLEQYREGMASDTPHLLMSVTKSLVGCVAGILQERGALDVDRPVCIYVPEVSDSGYGGASVRNLLDMRTGVAFREAYTDPNAEVRVLERHIGWRPGEPTNGVGLYAYLAQLRSGGPHGGDFVYRSADTDMLGWVCERATGTRMAELISELIWRPLGPEFDADITCDGVGTAIHDGGASTTARDLARFGRMLSHDGWAGGTPVVPEQWLRQARTVDGDLRRAFAASDSEPFLTGGWYRNQFWFVPGPFGEIQLCLGIHGQMVLIDRGARTVAVKLSTWPTAQDPARLIDTIRAFTAIGHALS